MDSLADRIAARLHAALDRQVAAGFVAIQAQRGLASGGPEEPVIVLTVDDVARIAAQVAQGGDSTPSA
jgi:hypothetical protein